MFAAAAQTLGYAFSGNGKIDGTPASIIRLNSV
jgi:hypothetical protein